MSVNTIIDNDLLSIQEARILAENAREAQKLLAAFPQEKLDEIVEILVDTVCTSRKTIRIASDDFPAEVVRSRFLKLTGSHIQYVLACMKENTTRIRNIKKYLLAALYNASVTMGSYYSALVQHDLAEGG